MPSPCYNRITFIGKAAEHLEPFFIALTSEENLMVFDEIVPMPSCLKDVFWGGLTFDDGKPQMFKFTRDPEERVRPLTDDEVREVEKTGCNSEYEWRQTNWGCNGIICDVMSYSQGEFAEIAFNTEYTPVKPLIAELRKRYPDTQITAFYDQPYCKEAAYY